MTRTLLLSAFLLLSAPLSAQTSNPRDPTLDGALVKDTTLLNVRDRLMAVRVSAGRSRSALNSALTQNAKVITRIDANHRTPALDSIRVEAVRARAFSQSAVTYADRVIKDIDAAIGKLDATVLADVDWSRAEIDVGATMTVPVDPVSIQVINRLPAGRYLVGRAISVYPRPGMVP